ncbi:MAG TPA: N-acetylmuramoyl-L-alanine amidase [Kiloniellales bacterium]|nr:N-acetylmuramoyl-L-alanine amidase [Kiloniellales bacterium]
MPCRKQRAGLKCLALAFFLLLGLTLDAAARPAVLDARAGIHPGMTRVVLELSEASAWRVFALPNPNRVVIDLQEVTWPSPPADFAAGYVSSLRFGLFTPGISRVVLDLERPAAVRQVLELPPQDGRLHRLVIDLEEVPSAAFHTAAVNRIEESASRLPPIEIALPGAPAPPRDRRPTIVIDAGHGGVDPGAIGVSGTKEKDLTLAYSRALAEELRASGRFRVVTTRDDDRFIPLRQRFAIAEQAKADLFISLHANTHPSGSIRGASVYTLSEDASDAEAAAIAARENRADAVGGLDLSVQPTEVGKVLLGLAQRDTMNLSKSYAVMLVEQLGKRVELLRNTHRFAGFAVLKSPTVPSVLLEIGYISHREEERKLRDRTHRQRVVEAVAESVARHFEVQQAWYQ